MTKQEIENRWPNLEVFGPQWTRVLGMRSPVRARFMRTKHAKLTKDETRSRLAHKANAKKAKLRRAA